jgi:hypothetical protein
MNEHTEALPDYWLASPDGRADRTPDRGDRHRLPAAPLGARQGRLAAEEGIFAGASSGANVVAALRVAERLGAGHTVATIMVDSGLRYLSTELYAPQHNGLE